MRYCSTTPYTEEEISKVPCSRCGGISQQQWNICSDPDGNVYRAICTECDIELNRLVLEFMGFENVDALIQGYERKLRKNDVSE